MIDLVQAIFRAAVDAVLPNKLVSEALKITKSAGHDILEVKFTKNTYILNKNVYVVAFGKAACGMSRAAENLLSNHLVKGIANVPFGTIDVLRKNKLWDMVPLANSKIDYVEGAKNNIPDAAVYESAKKIKDLCTNLKETDLLLVLVSGGGSALLPCPPKQITLEDKITIIKLLSSRGADINQLNTVRQQLSELKGGGLAQFAYPGKVISLIFSDIIGNELQFVASGPTVPSTTNPRDALHIITTFCSENEIPKSVNAYLEEKMNSKRMSKTFNHVANVFLADSRVALEAAKNYSQSTLNRPAFIVSNSISGEASTIGRQFAQLTSSLISFCGVSTSRDELENNFSNLLPQVKSSLNKTLYDFLTERKTTGKFEFCLIWGGETTVTVKGRGKGGRNQEMVLAYCHEARKLKLDKSNTDFVFYSAGTDGQDGPTDAAGAFIDKASLATPCDETELVTFLNNNDSYTFFEKFSNGRYHLKCGLTGTNVMDVQILTLRQ